MAYEMKVGKGSAFPVQEDDERLGVPILSGTITIDDWVKKIESHLTYIVLNRSTKHYTHLQGGKRNFLTMMVHEHFKLDMCVYGQLG